MVLGSKNVELVREGLLLRLCGPTISTRILLKKNLVPMSSTCAQSAGENLSIGNIFNLKLNFTDILT